VISRFFIDRPIFASVVSIIITLAGGLALLSLPIAQYPPITPPTVQVSCNYPGANAQVLADTVAAPIEQQVNGVEGMLYMSSQSDNSGAYQLTVTFDLNTDLNTALVMVQNRVSLALPQLPQAVQEQGLTIKKKSPSILMVINFFSPDGRYDDVYLSNYATINVKDELFRLDGVGDINYLGERDYSIRVWLDPQALAYRNLTPGEVSQAIQSQSLAAAPGQVGASPSQRDQSLELPLDTLGRLADPEQFGDIVIKADPNASEGASTSLVRLRDVARVELASQQYNQSCTADGRPSVGLAIYQLPGTNALDVANAIKAKMEELKARFPEGLEYGIYHDTTPFIKESVADVITTLLVAILLVALVVLLFLQDWRATLIPLIAVPVAIVGTFGVMAVLQFSLNNISLFGLVLAIGIVVDDAIVVVENVERWLEQGLNPKEAARRAMDEVTGPVIAVALVLCAVFLPCAFISGITGQFFRQFAVTIAVSTIISALNSLTLSPALAAILLKPHGAKRDPLAYLLNLTLGWFFRLFNKTFQIGTEFYARIVGMLLRICVIVILVYAGLLAVTGWMFTWYPVGFIPQQDQGWLLVNCQLPDSASLQRTREVLDRIDRITREVDGVRHTTGVAGLSLLLNANSSNFGSMFVILKPFDERHKAGLHAEAIMARLRDKYAKEIPEASISVFGAPPVPGIGMASGFKLMVEDRGSLGPMALQTYTDTLVDKGQQVPKMIVVPTMYRAATPQLYMDVSRVKARSLGVPIEELDSAVQTYLGSAYIGNFNAFGRYWQVNIQAEGASRRRVEDLNQIYVRNISGDMVPLATMIDVRESSGPVLIIRYNLYPAAPVMGGALPGLSSGEAIELLEQLARDNLPRSMRTEWTELTFMQIKAGNTALYVFAGAVVFVFLVLAAQYESWALPLAVILVVPMCLLCALAGVALRRLPMDIFVQIGFVVLVGLACKNAILIVEFARQLRSEGQPRRQATTEACRLRLRPILMTSFAFILGVAPMVIAQGAGAEMRWSLGTAVFSGMLGVTVFGVFLTPVFFYVIEGLGGLSLLRHVSVQWVAGVALSAVLGVIAGLFAREVGFPAEHWAALAGLVAGLAVTALVQGAQHRRQKIAASPVTPSDSPDSSDPPSSTEARS
jgi:hydrophobe/amphiphile efflux-1 (HAE1) family protein